MRRIQFYPNEILNKKLEREAEKLGVSVSTLVVDTLNDYFGLTVKGALSESQLTKRVLEEIERYINNPNSKKEFDLFTASETFKTIEMTFQGKPSTVRAKIGKKFASMIEKPGPFENISVAYKENGKPKKNSNNAFIYQIKTK